VNDWAENAYTLRIDPANGFATRSTASGVVQALKLQSATEISNAGGGINGDSSCSVSFDSAVPVDGGGNSALFSIIQNPTTDLYCSITVPLAQQFGEGSDFYYQWQEYWDSNFLANSTGTGPYVNGANGGEGLKHVLLWANTSASGCSSIELMHVDQYGRGYPQINTDCGSYQLCIQHSGNNACLLSSSNIPAGDNLYEQGNNLPTSPLGPSGDVSYNCYANLTNLTNGCAMWKAGVWMTFYCHQHTGTWGTNNGPGGGGDLTTKCWFALPGQSMTQYINMQHYNMAFNVNHADKWATIEFTPYDTSQGSVTAPAATKRYANFILSTQPIPPPWGPAPPNQ
jgi:hypothetical protein